MKQQQDCSHEHDDASLVARVLAGDQDAFDSLFHRYAPSVQRLCTRLLGATVEAQDIAQEAALQAFLGLAHLREPARFAAWFHTIAANLAHSALRRRREESLDVLGGETMTPLIGINPPPSVEEHLLEQEIQEAITQALQDLSLEHRQAVVGFYLQGYRYEELAKRLGVPLSTLKWRLFEGRKRLKTLLRPVAETLHYSVEDQQGKEKTMTNGDVVTLHLDALRRVPFTRQYLAILRDLASRQVLPVPLTEAEFSTLEGAFRARQDANAPLIPQDLSQRLLESFGTHLQQVVINALVGQILYATATLKQGARVRSVDMRLAEALVLAVREDAPISITRSLFETRVALHPLGTAEPLSEEELRARGKTLRKLGREERLQWEEAVRQQYFPAQRRRAMPLWERLWAMLLISLTGSPDAISEAELRTLDPATTFSTREVTWDAQPMLAIQLPNQVQASWLLLPPALWETMMQEWQTLRNSKQQHEPAPFATHSVPDTFPPPLQQQAEEMLARLVELSQVRTAFLLNPAGKVSVWKGPETQESLQHLCDTRNDLSRPFLAQEREPGSQGQKLLTTFFMKPSPRPPETPDTCRFVASHESGWRLVVFFQEPYTDQGKEHMHQYIQEIWQAILHLLIQQVQN